jgi:tetratricopeptide (TPR) repeat protein
MDRDHEAARAYERALAADPSFADAHYNLSRVRERLGDRLSALRHLKAYRELVGRRG